MHETPGFVFDEKGFELKMSAQCELSHKPLSFGGKSSGFLLECEAVTTTGASVIVVFARTGSYQIVTALEHSASFISSHI